MRRRLAAYLDSFISLLLCLVVGLLPFFFSNLTTEPFQLPKLLFLVTSVILLLFLWILSSFIKGRFYIVKTPLDIPLICFLIVILFSTIFNFKTSGYPTIFGNFPNVQESSIAWISYIILYYVAASNLRKTIQIKTLLYTLSVSTGIVCLLTILSYLGIYLLPFQFTNSANFTPTGDSFSTLALVLLSLPLLLIYTIQAGSKLNQLLAFILLSLFGATIALTGNLAIYLISFLVLLVSLIMTPPAKIKNILLVVVIPLTVAVFLIILPHTSASGSLEFLRNKELSFSHETQLPLLTSWKISSQVFSDAPILGTGPATFLFNFGKYKPLEFNSYSFWNFPFDSAYNEILQVFGTLGLLGVMTFLSILVVIVLSCSRYLVIKKSSDKSLVSYPLVQSLTISSLVGLSLLIIHAATLLSIVITLAIWAVFMIERIIDKGKISYYRFSFDLVLGKYSRLDLVPLVLLIICLIGISPALNKVYVVAEADYYHHQALLSMKKSGSLAYQDLQTAETLNSDIDLYRIDLAQTNFALANAIAKQKMSSQSQSAAQLTTNDEKTIQVLLSQAINEAKAAITLSPLSSTDWAALASIYKNISGVSTNAASFALDAYNHAIQKDPFNPELRVEMGNVYYSVKAYDLAIQSFQQALTLKPDYAPAYYSLSLVYKDKGDLPDAETVANKVISLLANDPNSQDYKLAVANLSDLRTYLATSSATLQATTSGTKVASSAAKLKKTK